MHENPSTVVHYVVPQGGRGLILNSSNDVGEKGFYSSFEGQ